MKKYIRLLVFLCFIGMLLTSSKTYGQKAYLVYVSEHGANGYKKSASMSVADKTTNISSIEFISLGCSVKINGTKKVDFIWKRNGQIVKSYSRTYINEATHAPYNDVTTGKPPVGNYEVIVKSEGRIIYSTNFRLIN